MSEGPKAQATAGTTGPTSDASARRPYTAPRLRRLGSVREVTWGPGSAFEGSATGKNPKKGPV